MSNDIDDDRLPTPLAPRIDEEREVVERRLQDAFARDAMDIDQLDERLELARGARTRGELVVLVRDLPGTLAIADEAALVAATTATSSASALVLATDGPRLRLTAIFGGADRRGPWRPPARIDARAIFGGVTLDFRKAELAPGQVVDVHCTAVFGGVDIRVPAHVRVESAGTGVFGGFDSNASETGDTDAPLIRVHGRAVFGGVSVRSARGRRRRRPALEP